MAPSFLNFKELRRRSRASFRTEKSTDSSSETSNGPSTDTPESGTLTPPSIAHQSDPALNLSLLKESSSIPNIRPQPPQSHRLSSRYSVSGHSGHGAPPSVHGKSSIPVSQYAPRIANLTENCWVYQKVVLVHGLIGGGSTTDLSSQPEPLDGTLTVSRLDDSFPQTQWPVTESHFKALVYLQPGPNRIRFDFTSPNLPNSSTSNPIHASYITVHMLPPSTCPPLQLAILLASDSPETYDDISSTEKPLESAIHKFRMAAYMWQAFTAEQMWRNKLGRRAFRLEEEWTTGSATRRDVELGTMRSEARVHVIRTDKTVSEIRALNRYSENSSTTDVDRQGRESQTKSPLFEFAYNAVRHHLQPAAGQKHYVSVLVLDSRWDPKTKTVWGHDLDGGNIDGDLGIALHGSQYLHSYPSCFEDVVPAFTDCTPIDAGRATDGWGEAGSKWEAANMGIGAHLQQLGRLFGCQYQDSGIMMKDYLVLNRSFITKEAYSTRTKSPGGPVRLEDESTWHRLDCLNFRSHPCFRLPQDSGPRSDGSIQAWPIDGGNVALAALTGISWVEIFAEGDRSCSAWIEYPPDPNNTVCKQMILSEQDLRDRLPENQRCAAGSKIGITARSHGGGVVKVDDVQKFCSKNDSSLQMDNGKLAFRGQQLGRPTAAVKTLPGDKTEYHQVIFTSAVKPERVMSRVKVYLDDGMVAGLDFEYDDSSDQSVLCGDGSSGNSVEEVFDMDVGREEYISGFFIRADATRVHALQILTSLGRRSPLFGNIKIGTPQTIIPPRGYSVCGVAGSCCKASLVGFSILVTR